MRKQSRRVVPKNEPTNTDLQASILEMQVSILEIHDTLQHNRDAIQQNQQALLENQGDIRGLQQDTKEIKQQNKRILQTLDNFIVLQQRNAVEIVALRHEDMRLDKRVTRLETKIR